MINQAGYRLDFVARVPSILLCINSWSVDWLTGWCRSVEGRRVRAVWPTRRGGTRHPAAQRRRAVGRRRGAARAHLRQVRQLSELVAARQRRVRCPTRPPRSPWSCWIRRLVGRGRRRVVGGCRVPLTVVPVSACAQRWPLATLRQQVPVNYLS